MNIELPDAFENTIVLATECLRVCRCIVGENDDAGSDADTDVAGDGGANAKLSRYLRRAGSTCISSGSSGSSGSSYNILRARARECRRRGRRARRR